METETQVSPEFAKAVRSDSVTAYLTGISTVLASIIKDIDTQLVAINNAPAETKETVPHAAD